MKRWSRGCKSSGTDRAGAAGAQVQIEQGLQELRYRKSRGCWSSSTDRAEAARAQVQIEQGLQELRYR